MPRTGDDGGSPFSRQVDRIVGQTVRGWRQDAGQTQQQLAEHLGISYQQVQKYEAGSNRITAGRLYEIVNYFGHSIDDAYGEVPPALAGQVMPVANRQDPDAEELRRNYAALSDAELRACIGGLVKTFAKGRRKR